MNQPQFSAEIVSEIAQIPQDVWNGLLPGSKGVPDNPFTDHRFLRSLEETACACAGSGWQPQHILLSENGTPVGLMPLYLKSHSQGEYVFDHAWADAFMRAGGNYYPKLQASIPFTPASAPKFVVADLQSPAASALLAAASQLADRHHASSVHATFVSDQEEILATGHGWLARYDTQFHWHNQSFRSFDDFLATLSSRKRKAIRRERRDAMAGGLKIEWLSGRDLKEAHWDAFFAFYMDTGSRKWGHPYLNRAFFSTISQQMAERIVLMLAYDGQTPIAGALNFLGRDTLYGRNWGAIRHVPFLHFELCYYQAIDYAIAHGLKTVEAGAQGEHKLARGYVPTRTRSVHWIGHPGLESAIAEYLERERSAVVQEQAVLDHYAPFKHNSDQD